MSKFGIAAVIKTDGSGEGSTFRPAIPTNIMVEVLPAIPTNINVTIE